MYSNNTNRNDEFALDDSYLDDTVIDITDLDIDSIELADLARELPDDAWTNTVAGFKNSVRDV